jgi:hypothetical protein
MTEEEKNRNIESEIITALSKIPSKLGNKERDSRWTYKIKDVIGAIGENNNFAPGFEERFDIGWLYDLIWYRNNDKNQLEEVFLVLESEWSLEFKNIKYDFEKLLVANAEYKIIIFQSKAEDTLHGIFSDLEDGIRAYKYPSYGTYILAGISWEKFSFEIKKIQKQWITSGNSNLSIF